MGILYGTLAAAKGALGLTQVRRWLIVRGEVYTVETAVRTDLTCPAKIFLDALGRGMWKEDPDSKAIPDDEQIHDRSKLMAWLKQLASTGLPPYTHAVNDLNDGVWEFKIGRKRLSFFDTPGDGTYTPKYRRRGVVPGSKDAFPWFPDFDEFIRLGHAFPKLSQQTTGLDLGESLAVREEDLRHDR